MRPPHDIVFKYTHRETARLIIANCTLRIGRRLKFAGRLRPLRSSSQRTLRWREMDSNFRFRASSSRLEAEILLLQGAHRRWMAQHGRSSVGLSEPFPENGAKPGFSRGFAMRRA
jgi:hypothetical protein